MNMQFEIGMNALCAVTVVCAAAIVISFLHLITKI